MYLSVQSNKLYLHAPYMYRFKNTQDPVGRDIRFRTGPCSTVYSQAGAMVLCPMFLRNLEGKVGKVGKVGEVGRVGKVGKVGKVGREGRLRE